MSQPSIGQHNEVSSEVSRHDVLIRQLQAIRQISPDTGGGPYTVTAGYVKDRAFNPAATTVNEIANVLATLIDDMRAAGMIR